MSELNLLPLEAMEWMPNDFSPGCLICQNPWTIKRRRRKKRRRNF